MTAEEAGVELMGKDSKSSTKCVRLVQILSLDRIVRRVVNYYFLNDQIIKVAIKSNFGGEPFRI